MRVERRKEKKITAGLLAGASLLAGGCSVAPIEETSTVETVQAISAAGEKAEGNIVDAEQAAMDGFVERAEKNVTKVANVEGQFAFRQDVLTPDDEIFNLYGTVMTGLCATPAFAVDEEGESGYYINVGGKIQKDYTVNVAELAREKEETRIMKCSCSMSSAGLANARVTGIPLSAVLELAQMEETVNCITVYGADGYGVPMPLTYALEKDAMLVYQINGHDIKSEDNGAVQLWMPEAVARYLTRNITHIELTAEAEELEILRADDAYRAKINILNYADDVEFAVGQPITLEGYADDYDVAVKAVEFSLDDGETWTSCETADAATDRWVYWQFSFVLDKEGDYRMKVRARTADGKESPLASTLAFHVTGEPETR